MPEPRVTVVIPTKDEEGLIGEIVDQVKPYADEVLVVDGHSRDRTPEIAVAHGARVIRDGGQGKGEALRLAIGAATSEIVVFIDADGSHDPHDIPRLVAPIRAGEADLVIGSRGKGGSDELHGTLEQFIRYSGSQVIMLAINYRWNVRLTDSQNGFRAIRRDVGAQAGPDLEPDDDRAGNADEGAEAGLPRQRDREPRVRTALGHVEGRRLEALVRLRLVVSPQPVLMPGARCRLARPLIALAAFVLLAMVHTWPLASNPAHLSRNDNGDALLNTWIVAWVAHQLPRDPLHLFDAGIFYPERLTLAYSEAMIVQGVMAMPILAAGGSAVLAYNLVLMAGMALTGWGFCLLVRRWTGSWAAGYVAGSLAAFNAHVLMRLPHLQTQHVEFVALMLFVLDRLVVSRRLRDAVWLGVSFALQGLTSVYLLVFTTWMLLFAVLGRAGEWLRREPARMLGLFVVAGTVATLLLAPYLWAYYAAPSPDRPRAHRG